MIWGGAPGDSSCESNGAAWLEVGHTPHGAMTEGAIQERNNLVNEPRIILPSAYSRSSWGASLSAT